MKPIYRSLYLLALTLLVAACNMDPFQPGRPSYDGGTEDSDAAESGTSNPDGGPPSHR